MNRDDRSAVLVMAASLPSMVLRLGMSYLRGKRKVNRAGRRFYRQLLENGVPPQEARGLTEVYTSQFSLRKLAGEMGLGPEMFGKH